MKLNKSDSFLKLYHESNSSKTNIDVIETNCCDTYMKRNESNQSDDVRNMTINSYSSSNSKSSYSSTSSMSSLSTNECILNCLNKINLNETVNESKEIDNQTETIKTAINAQNVESIEQQSIQPVFNSINPIKLNTLYKVQEKIRSGGFGDVYKGIRKIDNLPIAIKIIRKDKINQWNINNELGTRIPMEIELMYQLVECSGCIKILDYIEKHDRFLIIMERPEKSIDLWDYINNHGPLNENLAKLFFQQIVNTCLEMKSHGVLHRDIKDENILVNLNSFELKLIDFGAGTYYTNEFLNDFQGTRVYSPPEWITNNSYQGDQATVWSLGVLLYNMIYGDIPFEEDNEIVNCIIDFNKYKQPSKLNPDINDLITKCLKINTTERISLENILNHRWFQ